MSISFSKISSKESGFVSSPRSPETQTIITKTGLCLSRHAANRAGKRHVRDQVIMDALQHPLKEGEITVDEFGRSALRIIGKKAEVVLNPVTHVIVSVNKTKRSKARALQAHIHTIRKK